MSFKDLYNCEKFFDNPDNHTEENYLEAVKQDGYALRFVKNQSDNLCFYRCDLLLYF